MKKTLLLTLMFALFATLGFSQTSKFWSENYESHAGITKDKAVARLSFPKEFKLFNLNLAAIRQELFTVTDNRLRHSTVISLPNADGQVEEFEVFEASNFEPALQAQFPEIRAFSGKGITDKYATLKLSISPQGIQTMVFRTEKENEFIEPYSQDHTIYAVFKSHRTPGQLPWTCSTVDTQMATGLNTQVANASTARSTGDLKTMRLAQSVTAEYSNFFGATSASQVSLVLTAVNNTITRCNGVYEKDLAVHLNLIANTTSVFYYNPSTDPYDPSSQGVGGGTWNGQLQATLTSVIGEANYDIGHLFGATGGGGNAGCIGCICVNGSKGSGITSPADGIPQGDNFDIDYVVHEVGHQMGANHTYSFQSEGTSVQKEIGSGITIMGYAGITNQDVAPHSIDIYHEASIAQIQSNLAGKTCPVTTSITANNATPVVAAVSNRTIPISTPFALTGSATDANAGDVLTYCWEQNDNATTFGNSSVASPTKTTGPNWLSFSPTTSPTRICPKLSTILAGLNVTPVIAGGDAIANIEALSSVSRTLNFRLTVRDNAVFSSTAPVSVGQTQFTDMVVTVTNTSGPFAVTSPNTAVSWAGGSSQAITWSVANTTAAPVSCANVKISLSTDGGQTFPTVLAASTPNDGTETLNIPNTPTTTARIKIESVGNIFFDISNTNFTITAGASFTTITGSAITPLTYCAGTAVNVPFTTNGAANAGNIFTAQMSNASGSFASPVAIGTLTSTAAGTIAATIPAGTTAGTGYRIRVVSSNPVVTGSANGSNITVNVGPTASVLTAGGSTTFCQGGSVLLSGNSTGGTWSIGGGTTASLSATTSGDYFTTTTNGCGSVQSNHITVTVNPLPTASVLTAGGPTTFCQGGNVLISGNTTGGTWNAGGTTTSITAVATGDYFTTTTNGCGSVQSNHITVTVNPLPTASITAAGPTTFCSDGNVVLNANTGAGLTYQWKLAGVNIGGATNSSYTATASGNYTVVVTNANNCSATSSGITVTVTSNVPASVSISSNPSGPVCQNAQVVFTATPVNGGSGPSYIWRVNGVDVAAGNSFTAFNLTNGANVICIMTSNLGGCVSNNPATSNSITMIVNANPVAPTITAGGPTTFCQGNNVVLSGNNAGAWQKDGVSLGTSTSTLTVSATGAYRVVVTNGSGCTDTSNTIGVTVNPLPTVSFSGLASSYLATDPSATLTGSPAGGTFSGPGISGNSFSPAAAGSGGPYTITYTYTNGNGCTNISSHQTTVTGTCPLPAQPGTITTVGGTAKVCPGDVKTYTIAGVSGATSYTWTAPPGGVVTGGQGTTSATVTYNSGFTVGDSLRVKANNACGSGKARALKINRNAAAGTPSVITGLASGVCNSSAVPYSVTSVAGNSYAWSWNVADATVASGQGSNAITANFLGSYVSGKISVIASNACGSSSARTLTVYARPATPASITGSASVCAGQAAVPYSIAPLNNASSYIWYGPSGSHISDGVTTSASSSLATTATSVTVNFGSTAGQVRVKGINSCAAGSLAALTVAFTCKDAQPSIANNEVKVYNSTNVNVYPNPVVNLATMILPDGVSNASITVIDMYGKTVMTNTNFTGRKFELNTSMLVNGNYMIRVQDRSHYYLGKFLRQ